MRHRVVVALGVLAAGGVALPPDQRPTVGVGNATCDAPPAIVSYHVHAVWDASNASLSAAAREAFDAFAAAAGAPAGSCPFSHPNGAPGYAEVCAFPINWTAVLARQGAGPPDLLFGGDNFAFHVPVARLAEAVGGEVELDQHRARGDHPTEPHRVLGPHVGLVEVDALERRRL